MLLLVDNGGGDVRRDSLTGLADQRGEDGCRRLRLRLSQESRVKLVQLSHLGPQGLQTEGGREGGAEGRIGRGRD